MDMLEASILHYCKYQERCHMEVRNKLYELGFKTPEVERQISLLIENGVLNEERFAVLFAGGKFRMKHWGRVKIKQELKIRKISDYCIKKAMKEIDDEQYMHTLERLATKKAEELKKERSSLARKGKLYRYLLQKGYEQDLVLGFVKDLL